jgi:hypothetical protein
MEQENDVTTHSSNLETILSYQLGIDKAELILIALNALHEWEKYSDTPFSQILEQGQKMFGLESNLKNLKDRIGQLCDEIYQPIYHIRFPLNANDYLMSVDIDLENISDEETQHIIDDIEMTHGKINWEAL